MRGIGVGRDVVVDGKWIVGGQENGRVTPIEIAKADAWD
jgi:hypothetical protein